MITCDLKVELKHSVLVRKKCLDIQDEVLGKKSINFSPGLVVLGRFKLVEECKKNKDEIVQEQHSSGKMVVSLL